MTAAPSSRTTRAPGAAAACTRPAGPTAAIRSSRTSIDRDDPALAVIVTMCASVSSASTIQPSIDAAGTGSQRHSGHILRHGREDGTSWCRSSRSAWHDSALPDRGARRAASYFALRDGKIVSLAVIFNQPSPH
jgi:hypothetical protein